MKRVAKVFGLLNSPRKILIGGFCFISSFCLIWMLSQHFQIIISETDSHPKHYFLCILKLQAKLGDYVLLDSHWYGKKIIKQIIGIEGNKIWYDSDHCLWVNDKKIGLLKSISKNKRKLSPIPNQIIPKGYVFVYSSHESSFDSRYQELGLIPVLAIEGKVIPLV